MEWKIPAPSARERMRTVKAACDDAPAGRKKDAAIAHYQLAEKAEKAGYDGECNRQLDTAGRALAGTTPRQELARIGHWQGQRSSGPS